MRDAASLRHDETTKSWRMATLRVALVWIRPKASMPLELKMYILTKQEALQKNHFLPSVSTISAKQSLQFIGAKIWNDLQLQWKNYSCNSSKKLLRANYLQANNSKM